MITVIVDALSLVVNVSGTAWMLNLWFCQGRIRITDEAKNTLLTKRLVPLITFIGILAVIFTTVSMISDFPDTIAPSSCGAVVYLAVLALHSLRLAFMPSSRIAV